LVEIHDNGQAHEYPRARATSEEVVHLKTPQLYLSPVVGWTLIARDIFFFAFLEFFGCLTFLNFPPSVDIMGFVNLKEKMYVKELCLNQKPPLVEKGAT